MTRLRSRFQRSFRLAPVIACAIAGVVSVSSRTTPALRGDAARFSLVHLPVDTTPQSPAAFRLGTAARPYGWSTRIADFNKDGSPDLAIADRVGRDGPSYEYRLQFSVSGLETETVALRSDQDAVVLGVSDVDHDDDLDIVVSGVLSHAIVGVWLNDGHGRFGRSDIKPLPSLAAADTIGTEDHAMSVAAVTASNRQMALKASRARSPGSQRGSAVVSQNAGIAPGSARSSQPARAPPLNPSPSIG